MTTAPARPRYARIAREVRSLLAASRISEPQVPVADMARASGATVVYQAFDDDVSGLVFKERDRFVIGIATGQPLARQRFTLAHELGHILLHQFPSVHVDKTFGVMFRSPKSTTAVDIFEIEANAFAAELLMPEAFLAKDLKTSTLDMEDGQQVTELAARYGVSTQALNYRLLNLLSLKRISV